MSLSLWLPVGGFIFGGYFLQHVRKQSAMVAQLRLRGLAHVRGLRRLLEALPAHRGMANALLQGDASFRDKLAAQGRKIDGDMALLKDMIAGGDPWGVAERAARIADQWSSIQRDLGGLRSRDSFARHTDLIAELLYLMHDTARAAGLLDAADATTSRLADAAVNHLPLVTEMLGQARGVGTGVAAKGKCGTAMRVKLSYLLQKARAVAEEVSQVTAGVLAADAAFKAKAKHALAESQAAQTRFLDLLEGRIINSREVSIPPGEYFAAGTQAVERSFVLLDNLFAAMQARLERDAQESARRLWFARGGAIAACLPLLFFFVA